MKYLLVALFLMLPQVAVAIPTPKTQIFKVMVHVDEDHIAGGTGFSIEAPSGVVYTITNAHVCADSKDGRMDIYNEASGTTYEDMPIIKVDAASDLCILTNVPHAEGFRLGKSSYPNDIIFIFGHPALGELSMSQGIVTDVVDDEVFSTAKIIPGNSGSPVFDKAGWVVGVAHAYEMATFHSITIAARAVREFLRGL